jgi:DNA repair exonuclease SbcCD nuclease subunit
MSSVLILGDVHLGKGTSIGKNNTGTGLNTRIIDQLKLLDWTLDKAVDNLCDHIIITGDIFEEPKPHHSLVVAFIDWLKKCESNDVFVHIIAGNHDLLRSGSFYTSPLDIISISELEKCRIYKDIETFYVNNVSFTMLPFRDRKSYISTSNQEAAALLKQSIDYEMFEIPIFCTKVCVGHLAVEGSIFVGDEVDDVSNEIFCSTSMLEGFDYVWMGHVHSPQVMRKSPLISHIGSMDISNFGEQDQQKHVIVFDTDQKTYKQISIPTRNLKKISIAIPKDVENTTEFVMEEIKNKSLNIDKSIVKLEISLSDSQLKPVDRVQLEKFIYESGAFNIAGISESKKVSIVKKEVSESIDTKMDVPAAINMWAKSKWPNESDHEKEKRAKYVSAALSMLSELTKN